MERVDWENVQERMKRSEEEEAEAERGTNCNLLRD